MRKTRARRCPETSRPTEFEIHAEAYIRLRQGLKGFIVRGSWSWPCADEGHAAQPVFDIAIFTKPGRKLALIVELKRSAVGRSTSQGERYFRLTGVPTLYVRGPEQGKAIVESVKKWLSDAGLVEG